MKFLSKFKKLYYTDKIVQVFKREHIFPKSDTPSAALNEWKNKKMFAIPSNTEIIRKLCYCFKINYLKRRNMVWLNKLFFHL